MLTVTASVGDEVYRFTAEGVTVIFGDMLHFTGVKPISATYPEGDSFIVHKQNVVIEE